jgi:hypothetical protein
VGQIAYRSIDNVAGIWVGLIQGLVMA